MIGLFKTGKNRISKCDISFSDASRTKSCKTAPVFAISIRLSVRPHVTTREALNRLSWNLILGRVKVVDMFQSWLKSNNNNGHFTWIFTCVSGLGSYWVGNPQPCYHVEKSLRILREDVITQPDRSQTLRPCKSHCPQTPLTSLALSTQTKLCWTRQNCYTMHTFPNFL
jgi:hypothetical protein